MRNADGSGQATEHDSYHGDRDPGYGAGLGAFVIADQAAVTHEPAEGAFHDPPLGQDFEALGRVTAFDDLDHELGAELAGGGGEK